MCPSSLRKDGVGACLPRMSRDVCIWLSIACILACMLLALHVHLGRGDFILFWAAVMGCLSSDSPWGHAGYHTRRLLFGLLVLSLCQYVPCAEAASTQCPSLAAPSPRLSGLHAARLGSGYLGWSRRIATPCRSSVLPPRPPHLAEPQPPAPPASAPHDGTDDEPVDISQPVTLLELAVQHSDCSAFFLAATLVETLVDHFLARSKSTVAGPGQDMSTIPSCGPHRAIISLDSLLPTNDGSTVAPGDLFPLPAVSSVPEFFDLDARFCAMPGEGKIYWTIFSDPFLLDGLDIRQVDSPGLNVSKLGSVRVALVVPLHPPTLWLSPLMALMTHVRGLQDGRL